MHGVTIIGAGVIGCSVALELARRGTKATVLDRNGDAGHGSTSASCGIVRRYYSTRTMTAMAQEGAEIWAGWGEYLGVDDARDLAVFERPGMLFIPPAIDEGVERTLAHMRELGVDVELLTPEEVRERFPYLDTGSNSPVRVPGDEDFFEETGRSIPGAIFEHDAGYVVSPQLATVNLREAAERAGARFALGRDVTAIEKLDEGFRLTLDDGTHLETRALLNAAGPHTSVVNRMAGATLEIETRALRREVCAIENPEHAGTSASIPIVGDVDSGIYFRPESGGKDIIVGSLDPDCDTFEWVDPDDWNTNCTVTGFERQILRLMKRFPEAQLGPRKGIAGLYDVTPLDWHPILDRTDVPGYYVAIGTSGSSFKTAPVIGALMAELILACESGHDHDAEPLHLALPRTGFDVDVSFFSRHRGALHSSNTVLA
jgi:sarcosine oxidase subunit beta